MSSLTIRPATETDIPNIVDLLKMSLGESLMPKSETYWRWKHIDNPFGKSPTLLAFDDKGLVGVRAFMRWEWIKEGETLRAVRAVDTATHPNYQGQGVFKKLTLALLDQCKRENLDLVFNTPNDQSKPGYLKMGWEEAGQLEVNFSIKKPVGLIKSIFGETSKNTFLKLDSHSLHLPAVVKPVVNKALHTNYSLEYLKWRYQQIPVIDYYSLHNKESTIIYRLKQTSRGKELRVTDVFGEKKMIRYLLTKLFQDNSFDFLTLSGNFKEVSPSILSLNAKFGPSVTVKSICSSINDLIHFKNWKPSLGDLEVF